MTLFELVKLALDELYDEGSAMYGSTLDAEIRKRMDYLSNCYGSLNDMSRIPINYKDPATRFAYVYKYTASHGDYVVQALQSIPGSVFPSSNARLSCIGGGPGSDIVGVIKFIADSGLNLDRLTCYLVDGEQAWADTWTEIGDALSASVPVNVNFQPLDVTKPSTWSSQKKFLSADLFTLSYFVSEVMAFDQNGIVTQFWKLLFDEAKSGAKFLYVDNGHNDFNEYFDYQWSKVRSDIKSLHSVDNNRMLPRFSEQTDSVATYKEKFGQSPKVQSYLSIRILEKS